MFKRILAAFLALTFAIPALPAQHDYVISNATAAAVRSDLNLVLQAIASENSGATEPSTTYAYQLWADTTSGILKQRNAANSGWVSLFTMSTGVPVAGGTVTSVTSANADITVATTTSTPVLTLVQAPALRSATTTIDVAAATAPTAGQVLNATDSTHATWKNSGTLLTPQATTSGTSWDFTIPASATQVTVSFVGFSTNGTSVPIIQLGDAGGIETTGYLGGAVHLTSAATASGTQNSAGFALAGTHSAPNVIHGSVILSEENSSTFTWTAFGILAGSDANYVKLVGGSKSTSQATTTVRVTMTNGTDAGDAGAVNVLYR